MVGLLIAILVAAVVFWFCSFIGLPYIVCVIAAILVLLGGVPSYGRRP